MFKIFKYKSMYKQEHQKYLDLLNMKNIMQKENNEDLKAFREKLLDSEQEITKLRKEILTRENLNKKLTEEIGEYVQCIARANIKLDIKEKQRRQNAGKIGGLTTYRNKLLAEKKEMLTLYERLLLEIRKLSREKKKPTLEELRRYFKTNY